LDYECAQSRRMQHREQLSLQSSVPRRSKSKVPAAAAAVFCFTHAVRMYVFAVSLNLLLLTWSGGFRKKIVTDSCSCASNTL